MWRRWSIIFVLCVIAPMCRTVCPKWRGPAAPKKNLAKKLAKEHPPVIKFGVFKSESEGEKIKIEDCAVTCATHFGDIEQSHTKLIPIAVPSLSANGRICSCVLNYKQIESYLIEKRVDTVEFFGRAEKSFCSLRFWIDGKVPIQIPYEERANVLKSLFSLRRTDSGKGLPETVEEAGEQSSEGTSDSGGKRAPKTLKKSLSLPNLRGTDSEKSLPETSKDGALRAKFLKKSLSLPNLKRSESGKSPSETSKEGEQTFGGTSEDWGKRAPTTLKKSLSLPILRGTDSEKSLPETSEDEAQRGSNTLKKSSSLPNLKGTPPGTPKTVEEKEETPGSPRSRRSSGDEKEEAKNPSDPKNETTEPGKASPERKLSRQPSGSEAGTSKASPEIVEEGSTLSRESSRTSSLTKKEETESAKASPERRLSRQSSGAKEEASGRSKPVSEIVEEEPSIPSSYVSSADHSRLLEKKHSKRPSVEFKEPEAEELKRGKQGRLLTRLSRLSTTNRPEDIPEDKIVVGTFASKKAWFNVTICKVTCRTTFGFVKADDMQKIPFTVAKVSEDETECQCLVNVGTIKKLKMFDPKGHTFKVDRMPDLGPKRKSKPEPKPESKPEPKPEPKPALKPDGAPVDPLQIDDEVMKTRYADFITQCKRFYCAGKVYLENIMTEVEIPYETHKKELEAQEMVAKSGKSKAAWYLGNPGGAKSGAKMPDDNKILMGTVKRTDNQEVLSEEICQGKCDKRYGILELYPGGKCIGYTLGTIARSKKTCNCHLNIDEIEAFFEEQARDLPKKIFEEFVQACKQAGRDVHEAGVRFLTTRTKIKFHAFDSQDSDGEQATSCWKQCA
ncbi:uncharacterized protein [Bemisia tabaci]|uniref:uncharacterized protein n=1 Tax=Bemisia tabaci TaxID=7038 RepID=UPI003B28413B